MTGKNHIICGTAAVVAGTAVIASTAYGTGPLSGFAEMILEFWFPDKLSAGFSNGIPYESAVYLVMAGILSVIGFLLPDADTNTSLIGRYCHIPVRHRTWTHTLWACLILCLPCLIHPVFRFLLLGYILHIFFDSLSAAGICFLYPLKRYITYDSGAFIAPGHFIRFYHTGKRSETVCTVITVTICIMIAFFARNGLICLFERMFTA